MISIIICSIDQSKLHSVARNYATLLQGEEFEIIGIRDAKSLCEGYNRGFRASKGSSIIFSHDDIEIISPDFAAKLKRTLESHDLFGVVGTTAMKTARWMAAGQPHIHGVMVYPPGAANNQGYLINIFGADRAVVGGVQAVDGFFMACTREVAERIGFDERTFDGFHGYDADFSFSAYLAGFRLAVSAEIIIAHQSTGRFDAEWSKYAERFMAKHGARLHKGASGPIRGMAAQQPTAEAVLHFCELQRIVEMTARIRSDNSAP